MKRRTEPQQAEDAEGLDHGARRGDDSKDQGGDGRPQQKALEDAAEAAAQKGKAKEDAQLGARPKEDEEASRTTEAPRTGSAVLNGEGGGEGRTPGKLFFTPDGKSGRMPETPKAEAPKGPLFTPEQVAKMDELRAQAPLLDTAQSRRECEEAARPLFLKEEEKGRHQKVDEMRAYEKRLYEMNSFMDEVKLRMMEQQEEKTLLHKMLMESAENEAYWRSESAELQEDETP